MTNHPAGRRVGDQSRSWTLNRTRTQTPSPIRFRLRHWQSDLALRLRIQLQALVCSSRLNESGVNPPDVSLKSVRRGFVLPLYVFDNLRPVYLPNVVRGQFELFMATDKCRHFADSNRASQGRELCLDGDTFVEAPPIGLNLDERYKASRASPQTAQRQ